MFVKLTPVGRNRQLIFLYFQMEIQSKQSSSYLRRGFQSDQPLSEIPCPDFIEHMMMADQQQDDYQQYNYI